MRSLPFFFNFYFFGRTWKTLNFWKCKSQHRTVFVRKRYLSRVSAVSVQLLSCVKTLALLLFREAGDTDGFNAYMGGC